MKTSISQFQKRLATYIAVMGMAGIASPLVHADPIDGLTSAFVTEAESLLSFEPEELVSEVNDESPSELLQQRYPDGKIQTERYVVEDAEGNLVSHGPYKEFDSKGTVIRHGNYNMGKREGSWSQQVSAAQVQALAGTIDAGFRAPFTSDVTFADGKLNGDWTVSDAKGNPVLMWQFENGQRQGVSTWFDSKHTAIREITYAAGMPHGPATQTIAGQRTPNRIEFDKGRVVQTNTTWFEKGKKKAEEAVLIPSGRKLVSHDWWNSAVSSEGLQGEPMRHGSYVAWHPNGLKRMEGQFSFGEPTGEFQWWYDNAQTKMKGEYYDGKRIGQWTWWHENGLKMFDGSYEAGVQVGQWSRWDDKGKLVMRDMSPNFPNIKVDLELDPEASVMTVTTEEKPAPAANPQAVSRPSARSVR